MPDRLGRSSHDDRITRHTLAAWPRLLDVHLAAMYLSIGEQSIRDYVVSGILTPVELPGAILREKNQVIARPHQRKMAKLLFDREDLDRFVLERKAQGLR